MIQIVNKRNYKGEGIYIGRPSIFGNPYVIGRDGNRDDVLEKYEIYLEHRFDTDEKFQNEIINLIDRYINGEDLTFICWCAPQFCHGDIMKEFIENYTDFVV